MGNTQFGVLVFVAAASLGPVYTVSSYSVASNVISELAAQNTQNNFIMSAAFVRLGSAVELDGVRPFRLPLLPFVGFGVAFAMAGLLGHKPSDLHIPYTKWIDDARSIPASVSGVALTLGFGWLFSHDPRTAHA